MTDWQVTDPHKIIAIGFSEFLTSSWLKATKSVLPHFGHFGVYSLAGLRSNFVSPYPAVAPDRLHTSNILRFPPILTNLRGIV
jgi:hypothetical protein